MREFCVEECGVCAGNYTCFDNFFGNVGTAAEGDDAETCDTIAASCRCGSSCVSRITRHRLLHVAGHISLRLRLPSRRPHRIAGGE